MNKMWKLTVVPIFLILFGCPVDDELTMETKFINASDHTIYFYGSSSLDKGIIIPHPPEESLRPDEVFYFQDNPEGFSDEITYRLYVFKEVTIESHSWEFIRENHLYDELFDFTYEELREMNYKIIYTGK